MCGCGYECTCVCVHVPEIHALVHSNVQVSLCVFWLYSRCPACVVRAAQIGWLCVASTCARDYVGVHCADPHGPHTLDGTYHHYVHDCKDVQKLMQTLSSVVLTSRQDLSAILTQYQPYQDLYMVNRDVAIQVGEGGREGTWV